MTKISKKERTAIKVGTAAKMLILEKCLATMIRSGLDDDTIEDFVDGLQRSMMMWNKVSSGEVPQETMNQCIDLLNLWDRKSISQMRLGLEIDAIDALTAIRNLCGMKEYQKEN